MSSDYPYIILFAVLRYSTKSVCVNIEQIHDDTYTRLNIIGGFHTYCEVDLRKLCCDERTCRSSRKNQLNIMQRVDEG